MSIVLSWKVFAELSGYPMHTLSVTETQTLITCRVHVSLLLGFDCVDFCQNGFSTLVKNKQAHNTFLSTFKSIKQSKFQIFLVSGAVILQYWAQGWKHLVIFIITIITNTQLKSWHAPGERSIFKYLNPSPFFQQLCKAVFEHLLLFLTVTVCPLSLMPHTLSLSPVLEGLSAPSSSPSSDLSGIPSCSCDTSAHWRLNPAQGGHQFHHWGGWSSC